MIRHLDITPQIRAALDALHTAEEHYCPGGEPACVVEIPKLALAEAVLEALRTQTLARLPRRAGRALGVGRPPRRQRA